jgi:hypothetical protein
MKHSALICLFIFVALMPIKAQDSKKWFLGYSISPDLCYRKLSNASKDPTIDGLIASRNTSEHVKFGFTTGLNIKRRLNNVISLESGLLYSNKGYILKADVVFGDQVNPGSGQMPKSGHGKVRYNYKYIDLPLKVNAVFMREEKYSFYATAGVVLNMFLEQKNVSIFTSQDGNKQITSSEGEPFHTNKSYNISPFIGFGAQCRLGERLHLQIEPLFRYGMLPSYDTPIKQYLWNWGLNTVLYYAL